MLQSDHAVTVHSYQPTCLRDQPGCGGGVLAVDSLVRCSSPIGAVFVVVTAVAAAAALDGDEAVIA